MSFEQLPLEMVVEILSTLSGEERARLAATNVAVAQAVVILNEKFENKFSEEFPIAYAEILAKQTKVNDWQALYEDSNEKAYENINDEVRKLFMAIKARPFDFERCKEKIEAIASKMAGMEDKEEQLEYLKEFFNAFDAVEEKMLVQWVWLYRQSSGIAKDVLNEIYTKIIERYFSDDKNILLGFAILCHQPVEKIKGLLNASDVDQESAFGQTPLTLACRSGDEKVVDVLLEMGANINAEHVGEEDDEDEDEDEDVNVTPMMIAAQFGNMAVVRRLMERGADLKGNTTFKYACNFRSGEITELLATKCTDLDEAFDIACDLKEDKAAQVLLVRGLDPERALLISCAHGRDVLVKTLLNQGVLRKELLNNAMLNAAMSNEKTIRLLIDKGADVNATDEDGTSVLMRACQSGGSGKLTALLENGADINVVSKHHMTPLGLACLTDSRNVSLLLEHGADVNFALKHALISGHANMIPVLIENGAHVDMKMFSKILEDRNLELAEKILQKGTMTDYRGLAKLLKVAERRNDAEIVALLSPAVYEVKLQAVKKRAHECRASIRMINADVLDESHIKSLTEKYTALSDAKIRARHILPLISAINDRVPHEQFMHLIQGSRRSAALSTVFSDFTNKKIYDEKVGPGLPRQSNENVVDQSSSARPRMK